METDNKFSFDRDFAQPIREAASDRDRLIAAGRRFLDDIAEPNRAEGERLLRQLRPVALELLSHGKPIDDLIAQIWRRTLDLRVVPTLTIDQQIAKIAPVLFGLHWSPVETDLLKDAMHPGEKIVSYDARGVVTNRRTISRAQLRQRRPVSVTQQSWDAQFSSFPIGDPAERSS
jgi:hypothetical protein